jgi:MscS family membrane protein
MILLPAITDPTQMQELAQAIGEYGRSFGDGLRASQLGPLLSYEYGGVLVFEVALAAFIVLIGLLLRGLVIWAVDSYAKSRGLGQRREWFESLPFLFTRVLGAAIVLAALFYAFSVITLPTAPINWEASLWRSYITIAFVWVAVLTAAGIEYVTGRMTRSSQGELRLGNRQLMPLMRDVLKVGIVVISVLFIIQTWGYNPTALLAGVGLGGLAIAFAAQDTIANLFGTMVIYSDHPYKVGDHVIIAGIEGTVEEIGVRSTRIRKFDRTIASVPNKSVANENVFNLTMMNHRRIRLRIALSHATTPDQIEAALEALRILLSTQSGIVPNQHWVHLFEFTSYSQDLLLQCFTESAEYEDYLEVQENIMLRVRRKLDSLGLQLALPTQTVRYEYSHAETLASLMPPAEMPKSR